MDKILIFAVSSVVALWLGFRIEIIGNRYSVCVTLASVGMNSAGDQSANRILLVQKKMQHGSGITLIKHNATLSYDSK